MKQPETWPYFYKFLDGLTGPDSQYVWTWGDWLPAVEGDIKPCRNGYHVLTPDGLIDWLAPDLYRVEVKGGWVWKDRGKVLVVRQARLHSKVEQWNERNQRLIAAEFAQWAVDRYWIDKSDTRPQKAIDAARKRAKGEPGDWSATESAAKLAVRSAVRLAARSAARSAVRSAASSAAWSTASSAVRLAAESAASSAARSAARSAASSAARSTAWLPAWSAAWSTAWLAARSDLNRILIDWLIDHA